jgi:hypothetical protein
MRLVRICFSFSVFLNQAFFQSAPFVEGGLAALWLSRSLCLEHVPLYKTQCANQLGQCSRDQ